MSTRLDRLALGFVVASVVLIILSLAIGAEAAKWLPFLVGFWSGLFSAWGAFRLFGWGESAARSIYLWVTRGWMLVIALYLVLILSVPSDVLDTTLAKVIWGATLGLVAGFGITIRVIANQLRDEDRRP